MPRSRTAQAAGWVYVVAALLFLYVSLVPPLASSFRPGGGAGGISFQAYSELSANPVLVSSIGTSIQLGLLTAVVTTPLAVLAVLAVRELRIRRTILLLMILPLFIPGVSMGLAAAFFFRQLGVDPSLWTMLTVHVLWALPFAFIVVLTATATFDPVYLEAAYVHGAGRLRAFLNVELPLIRPGVLGAAIFALILSLNETVRTTLVQGRLNTVQTYIWSTYLQVGLSPTLNALMSILIVLTLGLVAVLLVLGVRRMRAAARAMG